MTTYQFILLLTGAAALCSASVLRAADPVNLALHCDYTSSHPNPYGWDKPGLTDGVVGEKNRRAMPRTTTAFPKTVTVDLGASRAFSTVVINVPSIGSTKTVEVSVSADNAAFSSFGGHVFELGKAQRFAISGAPTNARYVRLTYPDHYAEERGYNANFVFTSELEVYDGSAPAGPAVAVQDPSAAATTPSIKDPNRHKQFLERITSGPVGLLFLGDSITDGWSRGGEYAYAKFGKYDPANFGIGGDRTEHVLWRITHGELDGIQPKVTVIMIGTNNVSRDEPAAEAAGVTKIVETVREKLPQTKILLLGVFPRDSRDSTPRRKNAAVNEIISKLANGDTIQYLDIGSAFLDADGEIPRDVMPDRLHPNAKGYLIWYNAMRPTLEKMMQ